MAKREKRKTAKLAPNRAPQRSGRTCDRCKEVAPKINYKIFTERGYEGLVPTNELARTTIESQAPGDTFVTVTDNCVVQKWYNPVKGTYHWLPLPHFVNLNVE